MPDPPGCQSQVKVFVRGKTVTPDTCHIIPVVTDFRGTPPKARPPGIFPTNDEKGYQDQLPENSFEDGKCGSKPKSESKVIKLLWQNLSKPGVKN